MDSTSYDILILGAGPAGLSAALTARARGRASAVVSNAAEHSPLWRAPRIDNYPGLAGLSGAELLQRMTGEVRALGIPVVTGRATGVMPMGQRYMVSVGAEVYTAGALILASGAAQPRPYPGEAELLGRGVSYCATCDGMLYRGKRAAVLDLSPDAAAEAEFLRGLGCEVLFFENAKGKKFEILGDTSVRALRTGGEEYAVDGVFILRDTVASGALLPGLALEGGHIAADAAMRTNLPGVFAAGDCTGRPYQIAKAVGQGNIAALSADEYMKETQS